MKVNLLLHDNEVYLEVSEVQFSSKLFPLSGVRSKRTPNQAEEMKEKKKDGDFGEESKVGREKKTWNTEATGLFKMLMWGTPNWLSQKNMGLLISGL